MSDNKSPFGILDGTYKTSINWTGETKDEKRKVKAKNAMLTSTKFINRKINHLNSWLFTDDVKKDKI